MEVLQTTGPDAKHVKLISSDGHEFIVERDHALTSGTTFEVEFMKEWVMKSPKILFTFAIVLDVVWVFLQTTGILYQTFDFTLKSDAISDKNR